MRKNKLFKSKSGITLIALIITIIVLLILVSITLNLILGKNGIINKALEAEKLDTIAKKKEVVQLALAAEYANQMGEKANVYVEGILREVRQIEKSDLIYAMKEENVITQTTGNTPLGAKIYFPKETTGGKYLVIVQIDGDSNIINTYIQGDEGESLPPPINFTGGLYDSEENLIVSWKQLVEDYKLDIEFDYAASDYYRVVNVEEETKRSMHAILLDFQEELSEATILKIPNNVKKIGDYALYQCENITRVDMSSEITSIGKYSFSKCIGLKNIIIPNKVKILDHHAFYDCRNLENIQLSDVLETIGDACFYECYALQSIQMPDTVTYLGDSALYICNSLTSVKLSSEITEIKNHTFYSCSKLLSIEIPNKVEIINKGAFAQVGLLSVTIPDSVTTIGEDAFYNSELRTLVIGKNVTTIADDAFRACKYLRNIIIPSGVMSIGTNVFAGNGERDENLVITLQKKFSETTFASRENFGTECLVIDSDGVDLDTYLESL